MGVKNDAYNLRKRLLARTTLRIHHYLQRQVFIGLKKMFIVLILIFTISVY